MKIGVDTNVLFYFLNKDNPFHEEVRNTLPILVQNQWAVITQQNLIELSAVLTRRGLRIEEAEMYLRSFAEVIPVLRPTHATIEIFLKQIKKRSVKGAKVFDIYLVATLLSNKVTTLYTYNEKDFIEIEEISLWKPKEELCSKK